MATSINKNTFPSTYKDDYLDSDGYYRILFNSGKKLQARELTQMQTILQKQIERMGNNLFTDGEPVLFGGHSVDNRYEFIRLNKNLSNLPSDLNTLVGETYTGNTTSIQFEILEVIDEVGSDPVTLFVKYINTKNSAAAIAGNVATVRVESDESLSSSGNPGLRVEASSNASGVGSRFIVGESTYFVKGFFVFVESQSIILSKYTNLPTATVGFKIVEQIITASDDDGLYDNQGSVPNVTAPGADRYKINLTLIDKANISATDNFVNIANVIDGQIIGKVDVLQSYNIPNDLINVRIRENSGDYLVKPFGTNFEADSDNGFLRLMLSEGTAVVGGARALLGDAVTIRVPKATNTVSETDELVPTPFGNYVTVPDAGIFGMPNLSQLDSQTIMDTADFGGSPIGSCKVRYISQDAADWRYYLFDINMYAGEDFRDAKSIGSSSTNYFNPELVGGKTVLENAQTNRLLFQLPQPRPKTLSGADVTVQRYFSLSNVLNGTATINASGSETFVDDDEWLITDSSGTLDPTIVLNAGFDAATISGLPDGNGSVAQTINVATYVRKPNVSALQKTLTTKYIDGLVESNGSGLKFIDLHRADVSTLDFVYDATDSTNVFTNNFTLDNGQRDNFYGKGRAVLKPGLTVPTQGDVGGVGLRVFYKYFSHTGNGDFFDVTSYSGVDYKDIPQHTLSNGQKISLRQALDFRPVKDSDGTYTGAPAKVFELPNPSGVLDIDVEYYLPRQDRLVISSSGTIQYITGVSGIGASPPTIPLNTLSLYTYSLGGNTLGPEDTDKNRQSHKRHTMKDISLLEERVNKIERMSALSLLEAETESFSVVDDALLDRTKSGIVVDNFSSTILRDTSSTSGVDFKAGRIYPQERLRVINLNYDSDHTDNSNVIKKGDYVFPTYTEETYIDQSVISRSLSLNEFNVQSYSGHMQISPSSDTWFDVNKLPRNVTDLGTVLSTDNVTWYNKHTWNWKGIDIQQLAVGDQSKTNKSGNTNYWLNVSAEEEVVEYLGTDTFKFSTVLETLRSNKVYFKATGLQPSTRHFAFFNGIDVSSYCTDSDYRFFSDWDSDYGDIYSNYTEHPNGAADTLETNEFGEITGSFFIPNTSSLSFPTGTNKLEFLNISKYDPEKSISYARHNYVAVGTLRNVEPEYTSTRVLTISGGSKTTKPKVSYNNNGGGDDGPTGPGTTISADNYNADNNSYSNDHSNSSSGFGDVGGTDVGSNWG